MTCCLDKLNLELPHVLPPALLPVLTVHPTTFVQLHHFAEPFYLKIHQGEFLILGSLEFDASPPYQIYLGSFWFGQGGLAVYTMLAISQDILPEVTVDAARPGSCP